MRIQEITHHSALIPAGVWEERRRDHRYRVNEDGTVYTVAPLSRDRLAIRVVDMSRNGMKLFTSEPLDPGSEIQIALKELFALAEVRYCVPTEDGFYAGVLVKDVLQSSSQTKAEDLQ